MNHTHIFDIQSYDAGIEEAERMVSRLQSVLRDAYPDRAFTISYNTSIISFWQTTSDSPRGEYICIPDKWSDKGWCLKCDNMRQFRRSNKVHPRFEKAEWGYCEECGDEIMVTACDKLIFIEPA